MKKIIVMLCVALLLAIGVSAAETVIYQNDFSDPYSLYDFKQYRAEWTIKDEALYITDGGLDPKAPKDNNYSHIVYQSPAPLTDYIVEVDMLNMQSSAGLLFNVQQDKVGNGNSAIYGYTFNAARTADFFALGSGNQKGGWLDNINTGSPKKDIYPGANIHLMLIVKGGKIGVNAINIDTDKSVYSYTYSIGSNAKKDALFTEGSVGFRVILDYQGKVNANNLHFDNLVITTANETDIATITGYKVPAPVVATRIDTKGIVPIYTNNFDDASALDEFAQFYGTWEVIDGRLYLTDVETAADSLCLYNGKEELKTLKDYVLDVDMYNVQTQGGAIVRSQIDQITGKGSGSDFRGYFTFLSFTGEKGAIGLGDPSGGWGGNLEVSQNITKPGANVHIQAAVKGSVITYYLTEIGTGKILWAHTEAHDYWEQGTFGFRLCTKIHETGLDNVSNTSFDNLVISTFPGADKTEIKMTIDSLTATVNGEAKTLDAAPIIRNSRTMLPVRFVAENLGATVGWDDATKTVTVKSADTTIEIVIGATTAKVNGAEIALDSPAFIENSRTYLPVRVVAENLGATVGWDDATKTATLTK
ncbi:MAG: copper amine oxidase N-terminal domain-containing protein [Clostridia bacterium]|nr:copper amine oxidase N-terminal domain-containing protein [Clostridia bacterium]